MNIELIKKYAPLVVSLLVIVGAIYYFEPDRVSRSENREDTSELRVERSEDIVAEKEKKFERAKEISTPDGFVNSEEFQLADLIGQKVIIVDFMTYSCINCQRTYPYLNAWYEKYKNDGLVIVGMHTPEFDFEKDIDNVRKAMKRHGIKFPIVLDNDFSTWNAYENRYWPHKYLIDIDGFIVYDHIGEGGYEETEEKIQELLNERRERLGMGDMITDAIVKPDNVEDVDTSNPRSPEIYLGAWRNELFANGPRFTEGVGMFERPESPETHLLYLDGEWDIKDRHAETVSGPARIIYKYQAEKVFMVLGAENPVKVKLLRDGKPVGDAAGSDFVGGEGTVHNKQLYRLIEDPEGWGEHTLEIIIEEGILEAYTFTFG